MSAAPNIQLRPFAVKRLLCVGKHVDETLLRNALEPGTWALERAPDNATALALAQKKPFDLIVTSEHTSSKEDIELLRKIRRIRPHTRLIILTDESTPEDVITAMRERAFSYFSKPYSPNMLASMIRTAMAQPCWDDGIEVVSATPEWVRLRARCDLDTADRVLHFLDEISDLPDPERTNVGMAFREMLLNAIEHGARMNPEKYVDIGYVRARHMVTCRITDPGEGFAIDDIPHSAVANPPDDPVHHLKYREALGMRPGGFGVLLTRHLVDELIYNQNGNDVLLIKYLDTPPDPTEQSA